MWGGGGAHAVEAAAPGCERHPPGSGDGSAAAPGTATPPPYTCARPGRPREPRGCSVRTQSAPHGRAGARGHRPTPAECTMHLGAPVVPEEYMMKRGWLNGSCSNSSWGAGSPLPVARKSSRNTLWGHAGGANRERPGRWPGPRARRDDSPGLRGTRARSRAVPRDSGEADAQIHGKSGGTASTGAKATLLRELRGPGRGRPLGARRCSKSRCRCRW